MRCAGIPGNELDKRLLDDVRTMKKQVHMLYQLAACVDDADALAGGKGLDVAKGALAVCTNTVSWESIAKLASAVLAKKQMQQKDLESVLPDLADKLAALAPFQAGVTAAELKTVSGFASDGELTKFIELACACQKEV